MKLMLPTPEVDVDFTLKHSQHLLFMGSCFSDEMQPYFNARKFKTRSNPHGVLYNPLSIASSLRQIIRQEAIDTAAFYEREGLWFSFHHHSAFSAITAAELQQKINTANKDTHDFIKNTSCVFITLGTAWVYYHKALQQVVANNLKAPAHFFDKKLLSIKEISDALNEMIQQVRAINADAKIIFTLSPVRHARLGLVDNNRSKARLLEAIHEIVQENASAYYFPSYELVLDVLRDYRFYKKDLVHPNALATDAVWALLQDKLVAQEDLALLDKLNTLSLSVQHNILYTESLEAKKFIKMQLATIKELEEKFDYLDLSAERNHFENL